MCSLLLFCLSLLQPSVLAPGCSMPLCMCQWLPSVKRGYGGQTGKRLVSFRESLVAFELIGVGGYEAAFLISFACHLVLL